VTEELRHAVRQQIARGALPTTAPRRAWGGPGAGLPCSVCGRPVVAGEHGLQIEFTHVNDPPYFDVVQLHTLCFAVWELERES
jgi:hypothetical protein